MKLYVGNLPFTVTDDELHAAFAAHGAVTSAKVVRDRETNESRGFGFVEMSSPAEGQTAIDRMTTTWPTATLVHLPIHASWLNQVEIYFSVLQRKAISPVDFTDLDALADRILAFQDRYNQTATPFDWTFTRTDLHALLDRLGPADQTPTLPTAA